MPITAVVRGKSIKFRASAFKDEDGGDIVPAGVTIRYRQTGDAIEQPMVVNGAAYEYRLGTAALKKGKIYYSVTATDGAGVSIREDGEIELTGNIANPEPA
jgi:hypothetical protein